MPDTEGGLATAHAAAEGEKALWRRTSPGTEQRDEAGAMGQLPASKTAILSNEKGW